MVGPRGPRVWPPWCCGGGPVRVGWEEGPSGRGSVDVTRVVSDTLSGGALSSEVPGVGPKAGAGGWVSASPGGRPEVSRVVLVISVGSRTCRGASTGWPLPWWCQCGEWGRGGSRGYVGGAGGCRVLRG